MMFPKTFNRSNFLGLYVLVATLPNGDRNCTSRFVKAQDAYDAWDGLNEDESAISFDVYRWNTPNGMYMKVQWPSADGEIDSLQTKLPHEDLMPEGFDVYNTPGWKPPSRHEVVKSAIDLSTPFRERSPTGKVSRRGSRF